MGYFPHHSGQINSSEAETISHTVVETYPHMVTGATGETRHYPHMVTGGPEEIRHNPHTMTATQEEIPYCSPTTSSVKQKKARFTSQPQFRSENTPATIEADQILLALQHLVTNSNSVNFNNNFSRISKLPKSLTTTMPTFDGKSEKFELFEDLFQTSLKIHNQLMEEDKINYFHSLMRGDALQTFKNITSPNGENLGEILTVLRRKYVKPQSMATLKTNLASQTSPTKGTQPQNHVVATEQSSGNQTGNEPVSFLDCSKNSFTNTQNTEQHVVTLPNGDTTTPLLTTATPLIEEGLVRDEQTNEIYLPLTSAVVLKRKQEMLYAPLDFENNLTVDALVDSRGFVGAIAQNDLETIKQKAPKNILKIDDPPNFLIQVANGQLEKPLSTATLKFEIGDNSFAEHFVVMQKLTRPIIGLYFMRNNSVVIDTTHGLIHFPHLTMQVKTTSSETTTKPQPVTDEAVTIPPTTTKTITAFVDHPSQWNTTGTVTPPEKFTETASLLISHSM